MWLTQGGGCWMGVVETIFFLNSRCVREQIKVIFTKQLSMKSVGSHMTKHQLTVY